MFIKTASPVIAMDGTYKGCDVVFTTIEGRIQARGRNREFRIASPQQQLIQSYASNATKNWDELTQTQRDAWKAYAAAYFTKNAKNETVLPSALGTYLKANVIRQVLGLALSTEAPTEAPPQAITSLTAGAPSDPDTLSVIVNHAIASTAGLQVLVRMTDAMKTVAVTPTSNDVRYVRGALPASAAAVPVTGGTLSFTPTRFLVADGQRYGVEVRIVRTADGIMSRPIYGDFIKQTP